MGQINAVQTSAHLQRAQAWRPQSFGDLYMLVGFESSIAALFKHGGTWSAQRIVAALPTSHVEFVHRRMDGGREDAYDGHWAIEARGLRMDDFGTLFGEALGNGRAAA